MTDHDVIVQIVNTLDTVLKTQQWIMELMDRQTEMIRQVTQVAQM